MGIKIEVGRRYVDRYGRIRGPLVESPNKEQPFMCELSRKVWCASGNYWVDGEPSESDLIALAPDEAPQPQQPAHLAARIAGILDQAIFNATACERFAAANSPEAAKRANELTVKHRHELLAAASAMQDELATLRARLAERDDQLEATARDYDTLRAENARLRDALRFALNQMQTVRDGKTGGIPNDIIALLPEAIDMATSALAKLR